MLGDFNWSASPVGIDGAYQNAIATADKSVDSAIQTERLPGEDYITAGLRVLNTYFMADSQRKLLNVQLERAKQGLPPLDSTQYGLGVSLGLSPETQRVLMIGAGILGAAALLFMARRRR